MRPLPVDPVEHLDAELAAALAAARPLLARLLARRGGDPAACIGLVVAEPGATGACLLVSLVHMDDYRRMHRGVSTRSVPAGWPASYTPRVWARLEAAVAKAEAPRPPERLRVQVVSSAAVAVVDCDLRDPTPQ